MRVRMTKHITGYRNGVEWPEVGGVIDVPDHEARDLIGNGYAAVLDRDTQFVPVSLPDEEVPAEPGPVVVDLQSMRVADLRQLAKDRGVDLGDATKKDDIIAALELAEEEAQDASASGDA